MASDETSSLPAVQAQTQAPAQLRTSRAMMALLVAVTALAPLSLQIFIPALPAIQHEFATSTGLAQLTLSLAILANAFATLAYGPLSDRYGRRPVVLAGLIAFLGGSVLCTIAPSITILIISRIVQSVGAAAGMVLGRAIVRDLFERDEAASVIAYLTMAMVVAPMLAPTIGAVLIDVFNWRAIFAATVLIGLVLIWQVAGRLAETRPHMVVSGWGGMFSGTHRLFQSAAFVSYALQSASGISVFFAFVAGAPYFMIEVLGRSATEYGFYFILVSAGFMLGNFTTARASGRLGLDRMILIGASLALAATLVALLLLAGGLWHPLALFAPMTVAAFANGISIPNAQAGAVSVDPQLAGTASGLAGFCQMFAAALVSQAVGMLQNGTPYPMIGFMTAAAVLSLLGFVVPRRLARI